MSCIFCKIASKEIKSGSVYETDKVIAFDDIAPQAPVHVVVIPKEHVSGIAAGSNDVLAEIFKAICQISKIKGVQDNGYRVVINSGRDAGQAVEHLHFHLLGGRLLKWPPG
ncbi:MAG: histidine triad nucleotide-binding protein [bacterium]